MTAQAVREGVDLVLGAGGDGTIRVICSGLAGTGIPFGLIPAGTGNLLARNIGIPLDEARRPRRRLRRRGQADRPGQDHASTAATPDHFAVMAGIGIDAVIMEGTNPDLKKAVGSAAYFVSAAQQRQPPGAAHHHPGRRPRRRCERRAHVIVVGNVGYLQANIPLIPDAKPDDGLLDVLVASPRTARGLGPDHHPGADPAQARATTPARPVHRPQGDHHRATSATSTSSTATPSASAAPWSPRSCPAP